MQQKRVPDGNSSVFLRTFRVYKIINEGELEVTSEQWPFFAGIENTTIAGYEVLAIFSDIHFLYLLKDNQRILYCVVDNIADEV